MENLIQYYDKGSKRSYFFNPITGRSQWPFHTYKDKKTYLPKGWVRLRNSDGTFFYKFIGYKKCQIVDLRITLLKMKKKK